MENYQLVDAFGEGTYGCVWRAVDKLSGDVVAIKKLKQKYSSWEECMNLGEVKALKIMNHPNIVQIREITMDENGNVFFVFEYMECNLYQLITQKSKTRVRFMESEIKDLCFQLFHALAYVHRKGYFHRDLKPENLLVTEKVIKIADFGLARESNSGNSGLPYTQYVATRWYRAPEIMLGEKCYTFKVDIWAMGVIMVELFNLRPLFPGKNEIDQMYKICQVLGDPSIDKWGYGLSLAKKMNYEFPKSNGVSLSNLIPTASEDAISLVTSLLSWDPLKRPTAIDALRHRFFKNNTYVPTCDPVIPRSVTEVYAMLSSSKKNNVEHTKIKTSFVV